jgi:hypothetical protein
MARGKINTKVYALEIKRACTGGKADVGAKTGIAVLITARAICALRKVTRRLPCI